MTGRSVPLPLPTDQRGHMRPDFEMEQTGTMPFFVELRLLTVETQTTVRRWRGRERGNGETET
jgi:hypothetical protein